MMDRITHKEQRAWCRLASVSLCQTTRCCWRSRHTYRGTYPDMARQASRTGKERFTRAITAANKQPTPSSPTASDQILLAKSPGLPEGLPGSRGDRLFSRQSGVPGDRGVTSPFAQNRTLSRKWTMATIRAKSSHRGRCGLACGLPLRRQLKRQGRGRLAEVEFVAAEAVQVFIQVGVGACHHRGLCSQSALISARIS